MHTKVYVVTDQTAIEYLQNDDLEGFKQYLSEDATLDFRKPIWFSSEEAAMAFCQGLAYGKSDHGPVDTYPLRSCEESDLPYIQALDFYPDPVPVREPTTRPEVPGEPQIIYVITNPEFFCAYFYHDYEAFCNFIKNGEAGKIIKKQFTTRDEAERYADYITRENIDYFILNEYDLGSEPYVAFIEAQKCYV